MRLIDEQDVINRIVSVRHRIRKYKELGNEIIGFAEQVLTDVQTRVNCCPTTIPEFIDVSEVPPKFPCPVLTKDEPHCPVWCEEFVRRTHGQTKEVTYYDGSTLRINLSDDSATEWMKTFDFQGKRITHWMPVRLPCIELDKGDAE